MNRKADIERAVEMTALCSQVERRGSESWYACVWAGGDHVCGDGPTAWEAVQAAHLKAADV